MNKKRENIDYHFSFPMKYEIIGFSATNNIRISGEQKNFPNNLTTVIQLHILLICVSAATNHASFHSTSPPRLFIRSVQQKATT